MLPSPLPCDETLGQALERMNDNTETPAAVLLVYVCMDVQFCSYVYNAYCFSCRIGKGFLFIFVVFS